MDLELRMNKLTSDNESMLYKIQDIQKLESELRLKNDVLISTNDGLQSSNSHLTTTLKEV